MINAGKWEAIFLGTGSSSSVPRIKCKLFKYRSTTCVCNVEPFNVFNHRLNPSLILKRRSLDGDFHILIDMGKTFRESAIKYFEKFNISSVDSIIITHPHADAFGGLDDVRDVTDRIPGKSAKPVKCYVDSQTIAKVKVSFPYLFPELRNPYGPTAIGTLDPVIIENFCPFNIIDLNIIPIPLWHGLHTTCLGFSISQQELDTQLIYFSDFRHHATGAKNEHNVAEVTASDYDSFTLFVDNQKSLSILKQKKISVMILDCLRLKISTDVHAIFPETMELIKSFAKVGINPERIYLTGMDCQIDYHTLKDQIGSMGVANTEPGYDGLSFNF